MILMNLMKFERMVNKMSYIIFTAFIAVISFVAGALVQKKHEIF